MENNQFRAINETYEVCIIIDDEKYVDQLVVSLVRQGYEVYLSQDKTEVCFTTSNDEVTNTTKKD